MPKYRLTGASVGLGPVSAGVQWDRVPSDKEIAMKVIDELDNRRVLWEPAFRENPGYCAPSASFMREFLGTAIRTPKIGRNLKRELKTMQRHFQRFMSDLSTYNLDDLSSTNDADLARVLAWLRQPVGEQVGLLAAQYGLEVSSDLATIVPDRGASFFERK